MGSLQGSAQQITLFYSGTVNVYDGVPALKARAIMLLLSDHCSSNTSNMTDWGKDVSMQTLQPHMHLSKSGLIGRFAKASSPPRRPPTSSMCTTDNAPIIRRRSQAELPFARKASLARFLKKRKHRVLEAMRMNEDTSTSCREGNVEALGSPCKRMKQKQEWLPPAQEKGKMSMLTSQWK